MVTIFATTKSFEGKIGLIQRNAILSWKKIIPQAEIILFDNEPGTSLIAKELGLIHTPDIQKNELGTPLVSDIFEKAQKIAKNNIMVYTPTMLERGAVYSGMKLKEDPLPIIYPKKE